MLFVKNAAGFDAEVSKIPNKINTLYLPQYLQACLKDTLLLCMPVSGIQHSIKERKFKHKNYV
jgi:hypothetical protein